ncbi:NUDIX hydrolase [Kocuria rhizophila]|nr:NUDIX hydrolase [Kocuria rhizophila]
MGTPCTSISAASPRLHGAPPGRAGATSSGCPGVRIRAHHHRRRCPAGPRARTRRWRTPPPRNLRGHMGLDAAHLEQLATFGGRPPARRAPTSALVTVVYWAAPSPQAAAREDDLNVTWLRATDLPPLAFDHSLIVTLRPGPVARPDRGPRRRPLLPAGLLHDRPAARGARGHPGPRRGRPPFPPPRAALGPAAGHGPARGRNPARCPRCTASPRTPLRTSPCAGPHPVERPSPRERSALEHFQPFA